MLISESITYTDFVGVSHLINRYKQQKTGLHLGTGATSGHRLSTDDMLMVPKMGLREILRFYLILLKSVQCINFEIRGDHIESLIWKGNTPAGVLLPLFWGV